MDRTTKIFLGLGVAFALYMGYAMIEMTDGFWSWRSLFNAAVFIAAAVSFWGLWLAKRWGLWLSLALALGALVWGAFLLHFVWTFWIFDEPTFGEKLVSVLHPRVSIFVVFPVLWLLYFLRSRARAFFAK